MREHPAETKGGTSVFNRPLYLAGMLDNAADDLGRTWLGYDWNDRTRCNCGIVARQVLQASPARLRQLLPPIYDDGIFRPSWREMAEAYCSDTGLSRNEVFRHLHAAGFRAEDFVHLEDLSNGAILERTKPLRRASGPVNKSRKTDVVAYLRAWATGIEAYHEAAAALRLHAAAGTPA